MADDEKKTELANPLTPDILRKMALSGKSLPLSKPPLPDRKEEAASDGDC